MRYYPPRKPRSPDESWGRHWLPRAEQAKFRKALLETEGHRCFYCGVTDKPLQAHHETRTSGHMACQQCHNRLTQENQLHGNPPAAPVTGPFTQVRGGVIDHQPCDRDFMPIPPREKKFQNETDLEKGASGMSEIQTDARVKRHVERYREIVASRMKARHPRPWDRTRFLLEGWNDAPDFPGWVELADGFDQAVRDARGSMARFRKFTADL